MYFGQTRPMEVYDRQIRYLDYMENGLRTKGAGFIKLERQDSQCCISLQVSGLYRKDRFTRPLMLVGERGERELCRLQLADGGIKLYLDRLDCNDLGGCGLKYEDLRGVRIPISEGKEICATVTQWKPKEKHEPMASDFIPLQDIVPRVDIVPVEESQSAADKAWPVVDNVQSATDKAWPAVDNVQSAVDKAWPVVDNVQPAIDKLQPAADNVQPAIEESQSVVKEPTAPSLIRENKWEQLWSIYPHKCPFSDEREYLAVGPGDFVIFSERNYKLVNNSFLLHGYYNHHHLILTRIREKNQMCYYLGVPGNFYDREKRTAVMFGFKSFECASEPAREGEFGYYMIPVEL